RLRVVSSRDGPGDGGEDEHREQPRCEHQRADARSDDGLLLPRQLRRPPRHRAHEEDHDHPPPADVPERVRHGAPHQQLPQPPRFHAGKEAGVAHRPVVPRELALVRLPVVLHRRTQLRLHCVPDVRAHRVQTRLLHQYEWNLRWCGHDQPLPDKHLDAGRLHHLLGDHVALPPNQERHLCDCFMDSNKEILSLSGKHETKRRG
ncbi:hypothetical protein ACJX0J_035919, partial [Zea mays]